MPNWRRRNVVERLAANRPAPSTTASSASRCLQGTAGGGGGGGGGGGERGRQGEVERGAGGRCVAWLAGGGVGSRAGRQQVAAHSCSRPRRWPGPAAPRRSHVQRAAAQRRRQRLLDARHAGRAAQQLKRADVGGGQVVARQKLRDGGRRPRPKVACAGAARGVRAGWGAGRGGASGRGEGEQGERWLGKECNRPHTSPRQPAPPPAPRRPASPASPTLCPPHHHHHHHHATHHRHHHPPPPTPPPPARPPASSSNLSRVIEERKSASCHSSSTLMGASLLADRICLVRATWRRAGGHAGRRCVCVCVCAQGERLGRGGGAAVEPCRADACCRRGRCPALPLAPPATPRLPLSRVQEHTHVHTHTHTYTHAHTRTHTPACAAWPWRAALCARPCPRPAAR